MRVPRGDEPLSAYGVLARYLDPVKDLLAGRLRHQFRSNQNARNLGPGVGLLMRAVQKTASNHGSHTRRAEQGANDQQEGEQVGTGRVHAARK